MKCSEAISVLDLMLDDQVQSHTNAAISQHLVGCTSCDLVWQNNLAAQKRLHQFRDSICTPAGLLEKVKAALPAESGSVAASVTQELLREDIIEVMAGLTARERDVLRLRFGLDDGRQRTLEEVGELYGVSRETIRRIEAKALRRLRHPNKSRRLRDHVD